MHILIIDDEQSQRDILNDILSDAGHSCISAEDGHTALKLMEQSPFDVVLTDYKMPGLSGMDVLHKVQEKWSHAQVIIMTAFGTIPDAVQAIKQGAYDYLTKPFKKEDLLRLVSRAAEKSSLLAENQRLKTEISKRYRYEDMIGSSPAMQRVYRLIDRIKDIDTTVLISGESGTGKELAAKAIHFSGQRAGGPFVAVNCGAIPETLIESELFGHEKGAFTGATHAYAGKFEQADGGTILLDEIGTMRPDLQIRLLRVLQEHQVQRIGSQSVQQLNVRVIAASNEDLQALVREGIFREDLYHRLNVFHITLPPLREREGDIAVLARHFADQFARHYGKPKFQFQPQALQALQRYSYPGNIRELQHIIEKAVILADKNEITPAELSLPAGNEKMDSGSASLPQMEQQSITQALRRHSGSITKAASELGISYKTLQYRIKKYHIDKNQFK